MSKMLRTTPGSMCNNVRHAIHLSALARSVKVSKERSLASEIITPAIELVPTRAAAQDLPSTLISALSFQLLLKVIIFGHYMYR